jgi:hypothetical protein
LQEGITQAARGFPGYRKVDIYPTAKRQHAEWVATLAVVTTALKFIAG